MARVLVVDSDRDIYDAIRHIVGPDHRTDWVPRMHEPEPVINRLHPEIAFLELSDDPAAVDRVVADVLATPAAPAVVGLVRRGGINAVVAAVHSGVETFVQVPLAAADVRRALASVLNHRSRAGSRVGDGDDNLDIIGKSDAICEVRDHVRAISRYAAPVLILGESGTGKDLVARAVHRTSKFHNGSFVVRNCGAIPDSLFEAEMFGCEPGAYTGAVRRPGAFELANYGTLFLDEVGELSPRAQVKLLRALEDRSVRRVGGRAPVQLRFRVIAATNRDLGSMVRDGLFREDLYYRICVAGLYVPPLRHRAEDIPALVRHFAEELRSGDPELPCVAFTPAALVRLRSHQWPGNVRELRNVVHRSAMLATGGIVEARDLQFGLRRRPNPQDGGACVTETSQCAGLSAGRGGVAEPGAHYQNSGG